MIEWHKPNLDPETIAKIIREGREENDKKFESYAEYVGYIGKDNERILKALGSDYDEDGVAYWQKWEEDPSLTQRGYNYKDQQIEGRDNV